MISDETIQAVRDRTNIREVIGERVKLELRGNRLVGLCPFHKEKTPSFNVNEERGFYYCFGCHASGDAIKFIQETEGLSFLETIRELAQRTGIELVETRSEGERKRQDEARRRREQLLGANRAAADYFERCLTQHPLAELAMAELHRRGLLTQPNGPLPATGPEADALRAFRVGYAPYGWDGLVQHLKSAGFSPQAGESLGLIAPRKTGAGHYDRFRHRLMFAVIDLRGQVVGFSGRSLPEPAPELLARARLNSMGAGEEPAKYINSPESPIYKKREVAFGLFQARNAIRSEEECVLVEGNFDVVSLHARGVQNVVAPLGTAFTSEQAAQIKRYCARVTLLFDGDKAGRRATIAAKEPAESEGLLVRVANLPEGVDPDDLACSEGPEAVRRCVKQAKGMLEHQIETALDSGFRAYDPQTQGQKIQQVLELIRAEPDPTTRALARNYADTIAPRLGISDARTFQALQRAVKQASTGDRTPGHDPGSGPAAEPPERVRSGRRDQALEENILGALIEHPSLLQDEAVQQLLPHASGALALSIAALVKTGGKLPPSLDDLPASLGRIAARHLAAPEYPDFELARDVLLANLHKLRRRELKHESEHTKDRIRRARERGDVETEMALLQQLQERHFTGRRSS